MPTWFAWVFRIVRPRVDSFASGWPGRSNAPTVSIPDRLTAGHFVLRNAPRLSAVQFSYYVLEFL